MDGISWSSARIGAGLMKGFVMEELADSGDCAGFAGASRACSSGCSESIRLAFTEEVVERGNLTRGYLGGGGSPTRNSSLASLGETVREDRVDVVVSETEAIDINRALVLSSCSSSSSRLGEIIRRFMMGLVAIGTYSK